MKHKFVSWLLPIVSVTLAGVVAFAGVRTEAPVRLEFEWRWFGLALMIAIIITTTVLAMVLRRFKVVQASLRWFAVLLVCNIVWLFLTLAMSLSASAEAAAFWQGLLPMAWIPIPAVLLFFVLTYVNDGDMPLGLASWTFTLASVSSLLFLAGFTGLIERHEPFHPSLQYWGWQSEPGPYASLTYAWIAILAITSIPF
jgi:hypothetical protein